MPKQRVKNISLKTVASRCEADCVSFWFVEQ